MSLDLLLPVTFATIATIIAAVASRVLRPMSIEQRDLRQKRLQRLKEQITKKVGNGVVLNAAEIVDIGRGLGIGSSGSVNALYQLYSESETSEEHSSFRMLITELNRTEPFESLPEEARPSLARLSTLCEDTDQSSDKELLHPITKLLAEYKDMKRDHTTMRKQNRMSYFVALVSFFIGALGLILAFTGPSKAFIEKQLQDSVESLRLEIQTTQQDAER